FMCPGAMGRIALPETEHPGGIRAAKDLAADIQRVSSYQPTLVQQNSDLAPSAIIVGTLDRGGLVDDLVQAGVVDVSAIKGRWDAFHLQVVDNPLPNVARALLIIGADKRGTIYGIYDVSEQIGVSPWYYWADVPPARKEQI